jgi:hypothetical protein
MKRVALTLVIALAAAGCGKDSTGPPRNPPPALGTMTASVNGRGWAAVDASGHPAALGLLMDFGPGDRVLTLMGTRLARGDTVFSDIYLAVGGVAPGTFLLGDTTANSGAWMVERKVGLDTLDTSWSTDATHAGTLTITRFDSLAKTVAGTFGFSGWDPDSGVVEVTNGSFDVPYTLMRGPAPGAPRLPRSRRAGALPLPSLERARTSSSK